MSMRPECVAIITEEQRFTLLDKQVNSIGRFSKASTSTVAGSANADASASNNVTTAACAAMNRTHAVRNKASKIALGTSRHSSTTGGRQYRGYGCNVDSATISATIRRFRQCNGCKMADQSASGTIFPQTWQTGK